MSTKKPETPLDRVLAGERRAALLTGDSAEILARIPDASVEAVVTDPPAGISFMGKTWDHDHGGRDGWVKAFAAVFSECLRVLKPGAFALVWALPRTSHWTATALEDAGFEVRDVITHHFGTGFPKSLDASKAIDKAAGAKREYRDDPRWAEKYPKGPGGGDPSPMVKQAARKSDGPLQTSDPVTDEARRWEGFGTALKPASEHWILARKLLGGTVAANLLEHGVGALNIDGCRTDTKPRSTGHRGDQADSGDHGRFGHHHRPNQQRDYDRNKPPGRWPPNLLLTHSAACEKVGEREIRGDPRGECEGVRPGGFVDTGAPTGDGEPNARVYGAATVEAWFCSPGCPVAALDEQAPVAGGGRSLSTRGTPDGGSQKYGFAPGAVIGYGDSLGGASRFFPTFRYQAKSPAKERSAGLPEGEKNRHPTVKSVELMRWLCRLVAPPGGVVLDPFMGSGSTGVACAAEGFRFVGIEREKEYVAVAAARIKRALEEQE